MVELPRALQYVDQWRTLFRILTDLGNHSLGITPRTESASSLVNDVNAQSSPQPNPVPSTIQPAQFTGVESEQVRNLVKLCLEDVQRHDVHVLGSHPGGIPSQHMTPPELDKAYEEWLSLFKYEHSVIEDKFVEMLGRIFKVVTPDIPGNGNNLLYFRLKKLGILESNRPVSAQAVDHDTAATNDVKNDVFRMKMIGMCRQPHDEQSLPVE
jgi:hypothetical protein